MTERSPRIPDGLMHGAEEITCEAGGVLCLFGSLACTSLQVVDPIHEWSYRNVLMEIFLFANIHLVMFLFANILRSMWVLWACKSFRPLTRGARNECIIRRQREWGRAEWRGGGGACCGVGGEGGEGGVGGMISMGVVW